jgi:hypothetical protein
MACHQYLQNILYLNITNLYLRSMYKSYIEQSYKPDEGNQGTYK